MALLPLLSTFRRRVHATLSAANYPSADLIIYCPLRVTEACTVLRVFLVNGSSVSGNVNIGLYSSTGTKLWETGSTAQSGTGQTQFIDIADQNVAAGLYYVAIQCSGTPSLPRQNPSLHFLQADGVMQEQAGSFALPATATFAVLANNYLPAYGLDLRGAV